MTRRNRLWKQAEWRKDRNLRFRSAFVIVEGTYSEKLWRLRMLVHEKVRTLRGRGVFWLRLHGEGLWSEGSQCIQLRWRAEGSYVEGSQGGQYVGV